MKTRKFLKILLAAPALWATSAQAVPLISLEFDPDVDAANRQTFQQAANFWNSVITGYKLNSDWDGLTGGQTPHSLTILAQLPAIDGIGSILGQAGWTEANYYDNNPFGAPTKAMYYASRGEMQFDIADVNLMVANNTFFSVVVHEMGHVLGIGTLWETNRTDPSAVDATVYNATEPAVQFNNESVGRYTGAFALAGWQTEFGRELDTFVPVEKSGGDGTADGHWNEGDFGTDTGIISNNTGLDFSKEIMTGWASDEFYLSRVTLGSLEDLGYDVDYGMAGMVTAVPEPTEYALFAAILPAAASLIRRRRRETR